MMPLHPLISAVVSMLLIRPRDGVVGRRAGTALEVAGGRVVRRVVAPDTGGAGVVVGLDVAGAAQAVVSDGVVFVGAVGGVCVVVCVCV